MKNTYITIVGTLPIQFDLHESMRIGPVVASSNNNKTITFPYATVNSEQNLQDMLNSPVFKNTKLLCPEELFKKYVFFDGATCLPDFPGLKTLELDPNKCTPQLLSLLLSVYFAPKIIFLLGYDISNPIELSRLKSIAISNPATKFMYICNPPRTYQLDDLENGFCDNYIKYQEFIDARK